MRWTVEADTARDVIDWPEEVDDFQAALRADPRVRNPACFADPLVGALSARFHVDAERSSAAKAAAREIMLEALRRTGLRLPDDPLAHVAVTPSPEEQETSAERNGRRARLALPPDQDLARLPEFAPIE